MLTSNMNTINIFFTSYHIFTVISTALFRRLREMNLENLVSVIGLVLMVVCYFVSFVRGIKTRNVRRYEKAKRNNWTVWGKAISHIHVPESEKELDYYHVKYEYYVEGKRYTERLTLYNSKNKVPAGAAKQFKGHIDGTPDGIFITTGRTELRVTAEGDKLGLTTIRASVHSAAERRVLARFGGCVLQFLLSVKTGIKYC